MKKKNDGMLLLRKQEKETNEILSLYKSKYESLKAMFNQHEFGSKFIFGNNNNYDISPNAREKDDIFSNSNNASKSFIFNQSKNIVKPIKGGLSKKKKKLFNAQLSKIKLIISVFKLFFKINIL